MRFGNFNAADCSLSDCLPSPGLLANESSQGSKVTSLTGTCYVTLPIRIILYYLFDGGPVQQLEDTL